MLHPPASVHDHLIHTSTCSRLHPVVLRSAPVARRMSDLSTGTGCILGLLAAALKTAVLPHQDRPVAPLLFLVSWSLQILVPLHIS